MVVDTPEAEEVAFTLITNKKHKKKCKASFLSFISYSDFKSNTLFILWIFTLPKAVTTC